MAGCQQPSLLITMATFTLLLAAMTEGRMVATKSRLFKFDDPDANNQNNINFNNNNNNKDFFCPTLDGSPPLKKDEDRMYRHPSNRNCTILQCTRDGLFTVQAECKNPRCITPRRKDSSCCLACPDGENCKLPSGKMISADKKYTNGSHLCYCPEIKRGLGWEEDLTNATCDLITTTPPPTTTPVPNCRLPDRQEVHPGQEKIVPRDSGCRKYVCDDRGQLTTYHGKCPAVNCTKPERQPGACCMTCHDGAVNSSATADPAVYTNVTQQKGKVVTVDFFTFVNLLFGLGMPGRSHPHHLHRNHHHPHPNPRGSDVTRKGGSDEKSGGGSSDVSSPQAGNKKGTQTGGQASERRGSSSWSWSWSWSSASNRGHHGDRPLSRTTGHHHGRTASRPRSSSWFFLFG